MHSKPSSGMGDKFIESGAFRESALNELNIVWNKRKYGNTAMKSITIMS
jgi:hypothetical protein